MSVDIVERLRQCHVMRATMTPHAVECEVLIGPPAGPRQLNSELDFALVLFKLAIAEIESLREQLSNANRPRDEYAREWLAALESISDLTGADWLRAFINTHSTDEHLHEVAATVVRLQDAKMREIADQYDELFAAVHKANAERDDARREICMLLAPTTTTGQAEYATVRGWDCHNE